MKNIICLFFFLFFAASSWAQSDTTCFDNFKGKRLLLRTFTGMRSYSFTVKDNFFGTGDKIRYESIQKAYLGLAVHYGSLGGHFWFGLPIYRPDKVMYRNGKNKAFDMQANFYKKRAIIDFNFQNYQGLYLANPSGYNLETDAKGDVYREDVKLRTVNGNYIYEFSDRFSSCSSFTQANRQRETTGSALLMAGLEWDMFEADSNIIPQQAIMFPELSEEVTYGNFISLAVGGGYGVNFIHKKKYFCTLIGTIGPTFQWQKTNSSDGEFTLGLHYNARAAIGYNGDRWISGLSYVQDFQNYNFDNVFADFEKHHFKLFVGYRFNSTGLDKFVNRWLPNF
ncbi:MAG: DUF4421 domain-containing protein [Cytophagales bacterium]|nr:DUF4421 domain-containing protein [Cytophagales bacterium]